MKEEKLESQVLAFETVKLIYNKVIGALMVVAGIPTMVAGESYGISMVIRSNE